MTTTTAPGKKGQSHPSDDLDHDALMDVLGRMMLIRRFEERTAQAYQQAKIGGFCHLYIGQEASAVGSIYALNNDDPIITAYRDHGHALARGMDPRYCMAEMFGKITGCAKGKGGSMHMFDKPNAMFGGHAIVAGQTPLGAGLGFAIKYNKEKKVCVCYLGDGALNQGSLHEAMNLCAIWQLPVIFALENNLYSMGTHIARGTSMADDLSVKAKAYGMRYAECDGMGALKVYDCFKKEADRTRNGEGPCFINIETYRYKGHSMSDPQKYRTKDEVDEFTESDCIERLKKRLTRSKRITTDDIKQLDDKAKKAAKDAVKFAEESPEVPLEELYTDVYINTFGPYKKGKVHEAFQ